MNRRQLIETHQVVDDHDLGWRVSNAATRIFERGLCLRQGSGVVGTEGVVVAHRRYAIRGVVTASAANVRQSDRLRKQPFHLATTIQRKFVENVSSVSERGSSLSDAMHRVSPARAPTAASANLRQHSVYIGGNAA
ncbi:MAG: hypothetical protein EB111_03950 [Actinobacteria bacterium]|nr:hypothetical protein [Actinomycetota bacterium]